MSRAVVVVVVVAAASACTGDARRDAGSECFAYRGDAGRGCVQGPGATSCRGIIGFSVDEARGCLASGWFECAPGAGFSGSCTVPSGTTCYTRVAAGGRETAVSCDPTLPVGSPEANGWTSCERALLDRVQAMSVCP